MVNVSTSAQMAFVQPDGFQPTVVSGDEARTSTEYFPYFEVRKLKDVGGRNQFLPNIKSQHWLQRISACDSQEL